MPYQNYKLISGIAALIAAFLVLGAWLYPGLQEIDPKAFRALRQNEQISILEELTATRGVDAAWDFLKKSYTAPGGNVGSFSDLYPLAHFIGGKIYSTKGLAGLSLCDDAVIGYGCYPGFFKEALAQITSLDARRSCAEAFPGNATIRSSCVRGVGQGVFANKGKDLKSSLRECDETAGPDAPFCWKGVFMESSIASLSSCDALEAKYREMCARVVGGTLHRKLGSHKTAEACGKFGERAAAAACLDGLGVAVGQASRGDTAVVQKECGTIKNADDETRCLVAAAGEIVFQRYPGNFRTQDASKQREIIGAFIEERGAAAAWAFLVATNKEAGGFTGSANAVHPLAHLVGTHLYKTLGDGGMAVCDSSFAYGCYHGFLDAMLVQEGLAAVPSARDSCYKLFYPDPLEAAGCIHGIGHGLAAYEGLDIVRALADCDDIGKDAEFCWEGVFMEFTASSPRSAFSANDPFYPCSAVAEKYRPRCARAQHEVMRRKLGFDTARIAEECVKSDNQAVVENCLDGLGFYVARESAGGDISAIKKECSTIQNSESREHCLMAAAREVVYLNYPDWQKKSVELCESLSPKFRTRCRERIKRTAEVYQKGED